MNQDVKGTQKYETVRWKMAAWNATAVRTPIFRMDSQRDCCVLR